jgi:outer membrane lipoprotein-sorting protein
MNTKTPMRWTLAVATALAVAAVPAQDATPSVDEIVTRTNRVAYYQGKDGRAQVQMTITDAQGRTRERQMTILRRDEQPEGKDESYCGDQKLYVHFTRPADVNKMTFMVWKHLGKDDDRWLYLPSLDLAKRIAASDKRTSFVGSDFFYEDVSGRRITDDTHELTGTTDTHFVLKHTPTDAATVEFSYYTMEVDRKTFVPTKIDFYDRNGTKYRAYEALEVRDVQGYPTVMKARMNDLRSGGNTVNTYTEVAYDVGIPEDIFTERYLRAAPRKFLK